MPKKVSFANPLEMKVDTYPKQIGRTTFSPRRTLNKDYLRLYQDTLTHYYRDPHMVNALIQHFRRDVQDRIQRQYKRVSHLNERQAKRFFSELAIIEDEHHLLTTHGHSKYEAQLPKLNHVDIIVVPGFSTVKVPVPYLPLSVKTFLPHLVSKLHANALRDRQIRLVTPGGGRLHDDQAITGKKPIKAFLVKL